MKTVESRIAFSRFIFEDAEQCALQGAGAAGGGGGWGGGCWRLGVPASSPEIGGVGGGRLREPAISVVSLACLLFLFGSVHV